MALFKFNFMRHINELDLYIERIQSNMANNYKDNAQEYLKKFEEKMAELEENGGINEKQRAYYENYLYEYQQKLKGFTHKDQKPYWT